MYFVSQVDRSESNTKLLEPKDLEDLAGSWGAEVVRSSGEYAKLDDSRRHGREIWQYVLAAVLCLLLAEVLLQQLFSMRGP